MTKINQGFPGSQIANHKVQDSRALMSQDNYNRLLGPPLQESGSSITHFTDWASPPRSPTDVDVPAENQLHHVTWCTSCLSAE